MAYFFGDSFDLYAAAADELSYWDVTSAGAGALQAGRFGGQAVNWPSGTGLSKTSGVNDMVHHFNFSVFCGALGSGSNFVLFLFDGATYQCTLAIQVTTGNLLLQAGNQGAALATWPAAIPVGNTWYGFEVEIVIHSTTGSIAVRRNGWPVNNFQATGLNTAPSGNNYANKISVTQNGLGGSWAVDDFLWRSDASSVSWAGELRCYPRRPSSDVSVAWTPSTITLLPYASAGSAQTITAGQPCYCGFTSQGGSISTVTITLQSNFTGNLKCALFACVGSILGAAGSVGSVLGTATAAITNPTTGANTFTFSPSIAVAQGTLFYVSFCSDTTFSNAIIQSGSGYAFAAFSNTAYASFPAASPTLSATAQVNRNVSPIFVATNNAYAVADVPQDGANSYVLSSTLSQGDLYGIAAPNTIAPIGSVVGLVTRAFAMKSDAGTRSLATQLKSGSTTSQGSSTGLNTSWGWVWQANATDPNTGSAWTVANANAVQAGQVLTA